MHVETVAIASLTPDPANARKHNDRNIEQIKASLLRFGQQKPIVVDSKGIVRAGNGTLAAAKALEWMEIAVVRSTLSVGELTAYGIVDNRSAELAEWDTEVLAGFLSDESLGDMGFDDSEIQNILGEIQEPIENSTEVLGPEKWLVVVICKNEADQVRFLEQMKVDGRECRALLG